MRSIQAIFLLSSISFSTGALSAAPASVERQPDGITLQLAAGELRIQVVSDAVVRVAFSKSPDFFQRISIDRVTLPPAATPFTVRESPAAIILSTAELRVTVDRDTGAVSFADSAGHPLLSEAPGSERFEPAEVQGEKTFHVQQRWKAQDDESLYGLGQMQLGIVDIKGYDLDLWQHNTNVVVPFLVSSKGYGIFWDNTSFTRFGDLSPFTAIPADDLFDANGGQGGLTVASEDGHNPPRQTADISIHLPPDSAGCDSSNSLCAKAGRQSWTGSILAPVTGGYQIQAYSNGGIKVWLDGKLVMDHWRQESADFYRSDSRAPGGRSQGCDSNRERSGAARTLSNSAGKRPRQAMTLCCGRRWAMASITTLFTVPRWIA